jgi:hypothetical protein
LFDAPYKDEAVVKELKIEEHNLYKYVSCKYYVTKKQMIPIMIHAQILVKIIETPYVIVLRNFEMKRST